MTCLAVRMEEVFYEKLELKKEGGGRMNNLEHLAQAMSDAGEQFGANTPYGRNCLSFSISLSLSLCHSVS